MKINLQFGTQDKPYSIEADVSKIGLLAVHKSLDPQEKKGYVITHVPSLRVVAWVRLKSEAVRWRKELEECDWEHLDKVIKCLHLLREPPPLNEL